MIEYEIQNNIVKYVFSLMLLITNNDHSDQWSNTIFKLLSYHYNIFSSFWVIKFYVFLP